MEKISDILNTAYESIAGLNRVYQIAIAAAVLLIIALICRKPLWMKKRLSDNKLDKAKNLDALISNVWKPSYFCTISSRCSSLREYFVQL